MKNLEPQRYKFLLAVVCLSAVLVEGTGLAQQVRLSRPARPRLVRGNLTAGPGAFVTRPVDTTDELIQVIQSNPKVRKRYAKHFGIAEDKVVDFVKNALKVSRLQQPRIVNDYYVTKAGVIKFHREKMPVGTKVWATRSGLPVLKWICANPLTKTLPGTIVSAVPTRSVRIAELSPESPAPRMEGLSDKVSIPDIPAAAELQVPEGEIASKTQLAEAPLPLDGVSGAFPTGTGGTGTGGLSIGKLPATALAVTPFLLPLVTSGGSNNGGGGGTDMVTVPEPAPLALMVVGLPCLLGWCRRKR